MPVTYFSSADAGTQKTGYAGIKGVAGDLIKVLNSTLILDTGQTATGGGPSFADQTNTWIQMGAGSALFVANDATSDKAYFGGRKKFSQLITQFATLGIGGTCTYEYWDGSAWVALVTPTDGTSMLTAAGTLSWSAAAQTGWAQTAVNGITLYWIRISWASVYSTNPVLKLGSIYGWGSPYQGTSGATYRSMLTSGVQHYVTVNDNAPNGTSLGREAWAYAAEALTQYNTDQFADGSNGVTKPIPSMTQGVSSTTGHTVWRKSADTTTARAWRVLMDEKTFYFFPLTGDSANVYAGVPGFGEYFSLVSGDLYRSFISGRNTENSAAVTGNLAALTPLCHRNSIASAAASSTYIARAYTGIGGSLLINLLNGLPGVFNSGFMGGTGLAQSPNGPDAGIFIGPIFISEIAASSIRGRLRGLWDWGHAAAMMNDQDTFAGTGALSARTFVEFKQLDFTNGLGGSDSTGGIVGETSDTWETN